MSTFTRGYIIVDLETDIFLADALNKNFTSDFFWRPKLHSPRKISAKNTKQTRISTCIPDRPSPTSIIFMDLQLFILSIILWMGQRNPTPTGSKHPMIHSRSTCFNHPFGGSSQPSTVAITNKYQATHIYIYYINNYQYQMILYILYI